MTNAFVFTARTDVARINWNRTINRSIPSEDVFNSFESEHDKRLAEIEETAGGFYAWGAQEKLGRNVGYWEKMEVGDFVLGAYDGQYRCIARSLGRYHNETFAIKAWKSEEGEAPFEYMYFLSRPKLIQFDYDHAEDYLSKGYRDFVRASDAKVKRIDRNFGSLSIFFAERFGLRILMPNFQFGRSFWR